MIIRISDQDCKWDFHLIRQGHTERMEDSANDMDFKSRTCCSKIDCFRVIFPHNSDNKLNWLNYKKNLNDSFFNLEIEKIMKIFPNLNNSNPTYFGSFRVYFLVFRLHRQLWLRS